VLITSPGARRPRQSTASRTILDPSGQSNETELSCGAYSRGLMGYQTPNIDRVAGHRAVLRRQEWAWLCSPDFWLRYRPAARQPQELSLGSNHIGFRTVWRGPAPEAIRDPSVGTAVELGDQN
jgi:hypothetical protein